MKILHIGTDNKFLDQAIDLFEAVFPGANEVCLVSPPPYRYLKLKPDMVMGLYQNVAGVPGKILREYDLVILHSLVKPMFSTVRNAFCVVPTLWVGWGEDYYDYILGVSLIDNKSATIIGDIRRRYLYRDILLSLAKTILVPWNKKGIIERLTYFSPVIPAEYEMVKKGGGWKNFPKQVIWNYGALEDHLVKGFEMSRVFGRNVLVGNSATPTNNHYEAFEIIRDSGWSEGEVIVPLSYGNKEYAEKITELGESVFAGRFKGILNFMPIGEYLEMILSCGVVVMNHVRQQAFGTILIMLYLGAKVFLRKESPVYGYLKEKGAHVYCFDSSINKDEMIPVSDEIFENNRRVVVKEWGREAAMNKTRALSRCLL